MDDRLLTSFVTVARLMNMTAAAAKLQVTQSALSRQIQRLELQLGINLLERAGRKLKVSAEGEALLSRINDVLLANRELVDGANELRNSETGMLRVGACGQAIERFFPGVLAGWQRENPFVEIRLEEGGGAEMNAKQLAGGLHLAVNVSNYATATDFNSVKLCRLRLQAAALRSHLPRSDQAVEVRELCGRPLLLLNQRHATREMFDSACRLTGKLPKLALESSSPHTLLALAAGGAGVAIVPSGLGHAPTDLIVRNIALGGKPIEFDVAAMWSRNHPFPDYGHRFVAMLAAHVGTLETAGDLTEDKVINLAQRRG